MNHAPWGRKREKPCTRKPAGLFGHADLTLSRKGLHWPHVLSPESTLKRSTLTGSTSIYNAQEHITNWCPKHKKEDVCYSESERHTFSDSADAWHPLSFMHISDTFSSPSMSKTMLRSNTRWLWLYFPMSWIAVGGVLLHIIFYDWTLLTDRKSVV